MGIPRDPNATTTSVAKAFEELDAVLRKGDANEDYWTVVEAYLAHETKKELKVKGVPIVTCGKHVAKNYEWMKDVLFPTKAFRLVKSDNGRTYKALATSNDLPENSQW